MHGCFEEVFPRVQFLIVIIGAWDLTRVRWIFLYRDVLYVIQLQDVEPVEIMGDTMWSLVPVMHVFDEPCVLNVSFIP